MAEVLKQNEAPQNKFTTLLREVFGENAPKDTRELKADLERKKVSMTYNAEFKDKIQELLQIVKRKENREAKFAAMTEKYGEKLKGKTIDTLGAKDMFELDDTDPGLISRTFGYKIDKKTNEQTPLDVNSVAEGDEILVDFWANRSADMRIGVGDMIPSRIRAIKIVDTNGNVRIGCRRAEPRPGYYEYDITDKDNKFPKYIPVYSGYKILVPTQEEIAQSEIFKKLQITSVIPRTEQELQALQESDAKEKTSREQFAKLLKREVPIDIDELAIDNGENLKWEALWNSFAFQTKLSEVCSNLGVSKDDMKKVMKAESGLNPKVVNKGSGATGLIQFMPSTAESLGVTTSMLRAMPSWEQLDYVEKYFKPFAGRLNSAFDLYMVTFYPVALGKPGDYILGSESRNPNFASLVASQNPWIAKWNDVITVDTFRNYVERIAA